MRSLGIMIENRMPKRPAISDLAQRLGVSSMAVRNWIAGTNLPPRSRLPLLATALGVELSELEQLAQADRLARGNCNQDGAQAHADEHTEAQP